METKQEKAWAAILAELKQRVDAAPRGEVTALAKILGTTRGTVSRWLSGDLKGKRVPFDKTILLMRKLGLDPTPFFGGDIGSEDYMQVPWLEATASMGGGSVEVSKEIISHLSFRTDWLMSKGSPRHMVVINADGDSMEPTIPDGSVVLINEAKAYPPVNGKVYFVCYGEELFLKRLKVKHGEVVALISDQDGSERPLDPVVYFKIIARALWFAKEL